MIEAKIITPCVYNICKDSISDKYIINGGR